MAFGVSTDIGIDLGTASILVYIKGKGVVLKEPSVVAYDRNTNEIKAIGEEARMMIGRTPGNIVAIRPLKQGVIADYTITEKMIRYFIQKAIGKRTFRKPRICVCVPSQITEVERKAVEDATFNAGAREVYLVEEPLAAAIGAGIDITKPCGNMIVDIGGGTTDGTCYPRQEELAIDVRGRNLVTGLPKTVTITSEETLEALSESANQIVEAVHMVLEKTPPELAADISDRGIVLTGGGALLTGLEQLLEERLGITTMTAEEPTTCVAVGTGKYIEVMNSIRD